jgi:hypothetical protein
MANISQNFSSNSSLSIDILAKVRYHRMLFKVLVACAGRDRNLTNRV